MVKPHSTSRKGRSRKGSRKTGGARRRAPTEKKTRRSALDREPQVKKDIDADEAWLISPKTGKKIRHGGPAHRALMEHPKYGPMLKEVRMLPGSSNSVKHAREGLPLSQFCGPAGGAAPTAFPVSTPGRCKAALARAHFAPDPEGIRQCVYQKCDMEPRMAVRRSPRKRA